MVIIIGIIHPAEFASTHMYRIFILYNLQYIIYCLFIYNSIYKFSSHLALITGLNVETHVTVDPTKLVIIRSGKPAKGSKSIIEADEPTPVDNVNNLPVIAD